jgi:PKD repeat protein
MKMDKKLNRGIALVFAVLIMGLLAGSVSAVTFEENIVVSEKNPFSIEFTVEEAGLIYAEVELEGAIEEIGLVLKSPTGEVKREVWDDMPLYLKYEVSKDDIAEGTEWKISVRSGLSERAYGTLKITYPSDTTPPTITLTCSPENPTADQQITFFATASDRSGIDRVEILVNTEKVEECFESKCTYIGGLYPAGTSVSYGANAYDKAGNRARTGYKSVYISEPRDIIPPTVIDNTPVGTDVPVTSEITITFSKSMNKESTEDSFSMYSGQLRAPGDFYWKENMMIFKPRSDLNHDTEYVVNLEGGNRGAMDLAENIMIRSYNWEFKTNSPELIPPAAIISASATEIIKGEGISFSAEASSDRDGEIVSYYWDFGDGNTGAGISVEHTYPHSGHYTVTLTVTDNDKLSDADTEDITVKSIPALSVSIATNPVPSGESDEITVLVFSDGNPAAGANVYLSSTIGGLYPTEGVTDEDGVFVSTYTAPLVSTTQRYSISAAAEKEGYMEGINTVSNSIFVEPPPTTTPAPVVTPILTPEETPTSAPTLPPLQPIVAIAIAAIAAFTILILTYILKKPPKPEHKPDPKHEKPEEEQYGSISASSYPDGAVVSLDGAYLGISAITMDNILKGPHVVLFEKFGYFKCEKEAIVYANLPTQVHCDLTEIPELKLKLATEPSKIPAEGNSESKITIWIEDNNENKISVPVDVTVELRTNRGKIERQVKIPAGHASATATLTSSTDKGTATVEAKAEFLKGSTTIEFLRST